MNVCLCSLTEVHFEYEEARTAWETKESSMQKALADVRDGKRCPLAGLFNLAVWQDQLNCGYMCLVSRHSVRESERGCGQAD